MKLTIYTANIQGQEHNCHYPHKVEASDADSFKRAVSVDHVAARFRNNYRSQENYLVADHVGLDCDNEKSDDPQDWIDIDDVRSIFSGVAFAIATSRNHLKAKGSKSARPRFHVYFPIPEISDCEAYGQLKEEIAAHFPFFDPNALDSARFMFGNPKTEVFWENGEHLITDVMRDAFADWDEGTELILEGSRNRTLSRYAGRIIVRLGATEEAQRLFLKKADYCNPPLCAEELHNIWQSARRFGKRVSEQEGYIPPEEFGKSFALKPPDYSDIGQAKVLVSRYGDELKYTPATDYLRYDGVCWVESKQRAVGAMEDFLDLQLEDAQMELSKAKQALADSGIDESAIRSGGKTLEKQIEEQQLKIYFAYLMAIAYHAFVMKRRDMKYISSALQAAKPMLEVPYENLDKNPFLLNCPDGTYDLKEGMFGKRQHRMEDLITKITAVIPSDDGKALWLDSLDKIFLGNQELIAYVQMIAGLSAIGQVQLEAMIISYGEGSNGKSTFWNTVAAVLGNYSGTISADTLTVNVRRNVKPELAEAKGKRLLIAAELEEGMRLSTSVVKQLCSTDKIQAEKKYKDPASFVPSHTLVLYTNHLPKVGAMDMGIWRRLIVIPFLAKIEGCGDIKNYSNFLLERAAPYVLKWIIEGAQKAISCDFEFQMPSCVEEAIKKYRSDNDWLSHFLEECCEIHAHAHEQSGKLYEAYRAFCARTGNFMRSANEFTSALEQRGFERIRKNNGRFIMGLKLLVEDFI